MEKRGKTIFTKEEATEIIALINEKLNSDTNKQKAIRDKIRKIGFYFSDFHTLGKDEYNVECFTDLIKSGEISIK